MQGVRLRYPPDPLFPGGPLQNGQPSAEIQEEVALTSLGSGPTATNKRHSTGDKMHFPRASLQPITTLGMWPCPQPPNFAVEQWAEGIPICPKSNMLETAGSGCPL